MDRLYFCMYIEAYNEIDDTEPTVKIDAPHFFYADSIEDAYLYVIKNVKKISNGLLWSIYKYMDYELRAPGGHYGSQNVLEKIFENDRDQMEKIKNIVNEVAFGDKWEKMDEVYPYIEKFIKTYIDIICPNNTYSVIYKVSECMGELEKIE